MYGFRWMKLMKVSTRDLVHPIIRPRTGGVRQAGQVPSKKNSG